MGALLIDVRHLVHQDNVDHVLHLVGSDRLGKQSEPVAVDVNLVATDRDLSECDLGVGFPALDTGIPKLFSAWSADDGAAQLDHLRGDEPGQLFLARPVDANGGAKRPAQGGLDRRLQDGGPLRERFRGPLFGRDDAAQ